ncbi:MAG: 2-C-methyl-D-erythritol 2,4-cyclodiphosphate synthase [Deltaproteobacteria bacterium]|nr:2-C-methyl-D-erythritol 2,4-cyclodiphosphate synthase [Deltaproteobacteria bacterium]MBW2373381.1 2-C-methyl-D-erythritol 2,4-cyclodiphosphate synthase [Deltaproteobacteria bacterium]
MSGWRIGQGIDAHRLVAGRALVLGGVEIEYERGLEGHSDGDVLLHAVADAVLGAAGLGDLGRHFPSSREDLRGADSSRLLAEAVALAREAGFAVGNVDATVVAQVPRLAPWQEPMRAGVARALGIEVERVNVKVTSTDGLGAMGRGEGISALAVVLLERSRGA